MILWSMILWSMILWSMTTYSNQWQDHIDCSFIRSATSHDIISTWYVERAREIEKLSGEVGLRCACNMGQLINTTDVELFDPHWNCQRFWNKRKYILILCNVVSEIALPCGLGDCTNSRWLVDTKIYCVWGVWIINCSNFLMKWDIDG